MILLVILATIVYGENQVEDGTPQMSTRKSRRRVRLNILPEMFLPLMMRNPLVEEDFI